MNQQNQIKQGLEIKAKTDSYRNRTYTLQQKLKDGKKGPIFISTAKFWGDNTNKEFVLKFNKKSQVEDTEMNLLLELSTKQNQKEENELLDNVIRIFDFIEYSEYYIIIMEKGEQDLLSYIQKGQLTIIEKIQICLDISLPIYYFHINDHKHCEIILQNYVKVNNKFKLFKFGQISNIKDNKLIPIQLTSPELLDNYDNLSDKVDIWQLGWLFYQIYDGNQLFNGDQNQIKKQILNHTMNQNNINNKISQLNCQPEMKDLIIQMLQPNPNKRINITEVVDKLQIIQNPNSILISQKYQQEKSMSVNMVSNNQNQVNKQQQQNLKQSTQDKQTLNLKQSTLENDNNQKNKNISQKSNENSNKQSQDQHKIQKLNNQQPQKTEEKPMIFQQKPQQSYDKEQLKNMKEEIEKELNQKFEQQMKAQESQYKEEIQKYQNTQEQLQNKVQEMEKQLNDFINLNKQPNQRQLQENNNVDSVQNQPLNEAREDGNLIFQLKKEKLEIENQLKTQLPKAMKLFTQNLEKISRHDQQAQIKNNLSDIMRLRQLLNMN